VPPVRQVAFTGGELSPLLWGRTDLPVFGRGLRRMRNFFPAKHGSAVSRPGTTFCGYPKVTNPFPTVLRLVPFVYSDSQSFVLEFGKEYIRFWSQGALVKNAGVPVEVVTPFQSLDSLRFVQSGDVLTIVAARGGPGPYELKRLSNTNWTLSLVTFANLQPYWRDEDGTVTQKPLFVTPLPPVDSQSREWQYAVTCIGKVIATGETFETLPQIVDSQYDGTDGGGAGGHGADAPVFVSQSPKHTISPANPMTIKRGITATPPADPGSGATWLPLGYNYYRGRGGLFGFVGTTTTREFVDVGEAPDYARQPPRGTQPFTANEFPNAVTYFQERLAYGGSLQRPSRLILSATGDYKDFDAHTLPVAGEALDLTLAARKREEVRFLVPHTKLLALTDSSVRSLAGSNGPLDFDNLNSQLEEEVGCAELGGPLLVDGAVLFPRVKGFGVRALAFDWNRQGYVGQDVSTASQHLFLGPAQPNGGSLKLPSTVPLGWSTSGTTNWRAIYSWCHAQDPWDIVWAVTGDGNLLSLTYSQEQQIAGWARHDTDGWFLSVASIPDVGPSGELEDYVYAVVMRKTATGYSNMIERFTSRTFYGTPFDGICLDCAVQYSGPPTQTITGLVHLRGKQVYVTGVGNPVFGPYDVGFAGTVTLEDMPLANNGANVVLYAGLGFTPELELLDIAQAEGRAQQKTVKAVIFEVDNARGLKAGSDFDDLVEWRQREVADSFAAPGLATAAVRIRTKGKYALTGRAALQQSLPLPVTVVGITREVDVGGD
jgi:hypothetical protein